MDLRDRVQFKDTELRFKKFCGNLVQLLAIMRVSLFDTSTLENVSNTLSRTSDSVAE
jgi:hypothetical protein